jgi:phosphopantothenoylcysteine decarboxylase/phosphopantothenate--cysteine ligase
MGYALASVARRMGAVVTLVSGPTALEDPRGVEVIRVETAGEMADEVTALAPRCDVVVMAAAVADFRPVRTNGEKIRKRDLEGLTLELEQTPDILGQLGRERKPGQLLVGFAAETGGLRERARAKLREKKVDLLVANDVSAADSGFDADHNRAVLMFADGREVELDLMPKVDLAVRVWEAVIEMLSAAPAKRPQG